MSAEILSTVRDHFKQPKPQLDCCELLGRTVTMKMRGIKDKRLHIMFEKKINDLLFEAEMCALNNQVLTPSPQHYTPVPTPSQQHYTAVTTPSPQHYSAAPTPSPQHYTPVPTPSPQHYAPVPTPSPQHYAPVPTRSPQHYTPVPTPSPQHYTPVSTPSPQEEQNTTSHNNTESAATFISSFTSGFE
ncbi:uncharacterized protein [Macrobrachium rosenbergii]|uniref:uncharacterized protein n=1 Tax=Macrobrachium rosenbergii TaxID=79674 RepID=UPI0034D3A65D